MVSKEGGMVPEEEDFNNSNIRKRGTDVVYVEQLRMEENDEMGGQLQKRHRRQRQDPKEMPEN